MTNTLENKARFFAQYWGQNVQWYKLRKLSPLKCVEVSGDRYGYLLLKPLSQISDEDLEYIRPLVGYNNTPEGIGLVKRFLTVLWMDSEDINYFAITDTKPTLIVLVIIDFLRSRGYALPWMGLSVETLVEWGWVKLRGGEND